MVSGNIKPRVLAVSALLIACNALQASDVALEEVIVTATKRETSLMETPASISAFGEDARDLLGIYNGTDLVGRTPSLTITTFRVAIRGVGRPNLAVGSEPGVGIYWDGVYNTENGIFDYNRYLDIEQIEILRGPQGTLYGRNSIGGAISFTSKRPTEEWSGELVADVGNYDSYLGQGLVSGPITDKLGVLAAVSKIEQAGYQENTFNGKDYGQNDTLYGTLSLEHQTTDNWNTIVKVVGLDRGYRQDAGYILEPFNRDLIQQFADVDTGELLNLPGMFAKQNFVNMRQGLAVTNPTLDDIDDVRVDVDPNLENRRFFMSMNSEYSADTFSVKYTGGYNRYWVDTRTDADHSVAAESGVDWSQLLFLGTPVSELTGFGITPAEMTYNVNQEARFSSHELQYTSEWDGDWQLLGGLYYYHSDEEQVVSFREFNDDLMAVYEYFAPFVGGTVSDDNFLYRGEANVDTRSYATYGQTSYSWTDRTTLSAGLRYSYDEKKGNDNTFVQFVGNPDDPTVFRAQDDDWDRVTWRLAVDHVLSDNQFVYASIATGYRSGGFNFQKPSDSPDVDVVKPESLLSYEIGYKASLWQNRINLSSSIYYYDYEDLQVLKQDVVNGIGLNTFVNAPEAHAAGFEFEGQALLTDNLLVSGTYSYNWSEYKDFFTKDANACSLGPLSEGMSLDPLCTEDLNLEGNEFPLMPENKVSANVSYFWDMLNWEWTGTLSYFYTGDSWATPFNNPLYDKVEAFDSWNVRLRTLSPEQSWELTAYVDNIEDDRDITGLGRPSTVTQNATSTVLQPRRYGLEVRYKF
ncbi:MAG: TonB-dependent receptor [Pseudomonadota bacterium]